MNIATQFAYGIVAALAIAATEILFRRTSSGLVGILWLVIPLQVVIVYTIYMVVHGARGLIAGVLVLSLCRWTTRALAAHFVLGELITIRTLASILLVMAAVLLDKLGR